MHSLSLIVAIITVGFQTIAAEDVSHLNIPPQSLDLIYLPNNKFGGFYGLNVSVGTPPQPQFLLFDTEYSDILLHSDSDEGYARTCASQTPVSTCSTCE
jgi:hypothetical protein